MSTVSFKSRRAQSGQQSSGEVHETENESGVDVESLAAVWMSTLRVATVAPEDNFFEHGGTSLHAMLMASRVESQLSAELSLVAFFEKPTFAGFCESVRAA